MSTPNGKRFATATESERPSDVDREVPNGQQPPFGLMVKLLVARAGRKEGRLERYLGREP